MEQNDANQLNGIPNDESQKSIHIPKIIYERSSNLESVPDPNKERPTLREASTQTIPMNFDETLFKKNHDREVKELVDQIRVLKEYIYKHFDKFTQIHITSGGKSRTEQLQPHQKHHHIQHEVQSTSVIRPNKLGLLWEAALFIEKDNIYNIIKSFEE